MCLGKKRPSAERIIRRHMQARRVAALLVVLSAGMLSVVAVDKRHMLVEEFAVEL